MGEPKTLEPPAPPSKESLTAESSVSEQGDVSSLDS